MASHPCTLTGPSRTESRHRPGHGDPVVAVGVDRGRPKRCSPAADDDEAVGSGLGPGPERCEQFDRGGHPVGFFDPQLGCVRKGRGALGESRRHRQDGDLVDERRHLRSAHVGGHQRASLDVDVGRVVDRVLVDQLEAGPHAEQDVDEAGPAPADVDVLEHEVAARSYARSHGPEGGLGGVRRDVDVVVAWSALGRRTTLAPTSLVWTSMSAPAAANISSV